jgi:acetoin utilization protein AcuB
MQIRKIMSNPIDVVKMDDSLAHVKNLFELRGFHHLLVVENGSLVGVISDRDLLKVISPNLGGPSETNKDMMCLNKRVHQIMTRQPIVINANNSLLNAVQLFNRNTISCLPVVDDNGKPIGILSWRDILKCIEQTQKKRSQK